MQKVFFTRVWKALSLGVLFNIGSILSNACLMAACEGIAPDVLCLNTPTSNDSSDQAACIAAGEHDSKPIEGEKCVFHNEHSKCLPACTKEEGRGRGIDWAQ